MTTPLITLDSTLFRQINGMGARHAMLDAVMIASAQYAPYFVVVLLIAIWLRWRRTPQQHALIAFVSALCSLGIGQLIGMALPRARPYLVLPARLLVPQSPDVSFPSDHATLMFAITVALWSIDRRLGIALLVLSIDVAFARVYVGVHYPGDVLGGAVLGSVVAYIGVRIARTARGRAGLTRLFDVAARVHLAART